MNSLNAENLQIQVVLMYLLQVIRLVSHRTGLLGRSFSKIFGVNSYKSVNKNITTLLFDIINAIHPHNSEMNEYKNNEDVAKDLLNYALYGTKTSKEEASIKISKELQSKLEYLDNNFKNYEMNIKTYDKVVSESWE